MVCQSKHVDIEFIHGLEWNFLQRSEAQKGKLWLVLDDLFDKAARSNDLFALVVAS